METAADEALLRATLEATSDGVVVVDDDGRVVLANRAMLDLFGYEREELLGQGIELLIPVRYRATHERHRGEYARDPRPRAMGVPGLDLVGRRKDGGEFPVEISLSPVRHEARLMTVAVVRDVTERRQAAAEAQRQAELFAVLVRHAQDVLCRIRLTPPPPRMEYVSPGVEALTGYRPEEYYANPDLLFEIVHADDRSQFEQFIRDPERFLEGITLRFVHRNGHVGWQEQRISVVRDENDRVVGIDGVIRDVTARRVAERAREFTLSAAEAQRLRDRVAMDLHDEILQTIVGTSLQLRQAPDAVLGEPSAARAYVARMADQLAAATRDLRQYIATLKSPRFDGDLAAAVRDLAHDLRTQAQLEVTTRIGELPQLEYPQAEALFRIAQEATNNIWRHAHAAHVLLEAGTDDRRVWLRIRDDGAGFDPAARDESGNGLRNMRTRAELIGGSLTVWSTPGSGSEIHADVPLTAGE